MKRTMLMIIIIAGSDAQAVRRQESMSAGAELAARNEAEAKIKAVELIQKRTPAGTIRELEAAVDNAQAAINKLPGLTTGLQDRLEKMTTKTLGPILRAHAAGTAALVTEIRDHMGDAIRLLIGAATKVTAQLEFTLPNGNVVRESYARVGTHAGNPQVWDQLMNDMPTYAGNRARQMDAIIEAWVTQLSKEEIAKLKVADPAAFNRLQSTLKAFYDKAVENYIQPVNNVADATKQAEFRKAMKPLQDKIEEYKKEVMKKGFII